MFFKDSWQEDVLQRGRPQERPGSPLRGRRASARIGAPMTAPPVRTTVLAAALCFAAAVSPPSSARAASPAELAVQGRDLYRQGKLAEALPLLERAIAQGASGGELLYEASQCQRLARRDAAKGREYAEKAVALIEAEAANAKDDPAPHFFLAVLYAVDLTDGDKGRAAALRGVELAEKGAFSGRRDGESLFQVGQLYDLAGDAGKAAGWYERAVAALQPSASAAPSHRPYLLSALDELGGAALARKDYKGASRWMKRHLDLEPERERSRLATGQTMVKAGLFSDAAAVFGGFRTEELATEATYLVRILERHVALGASAPPAGAAALDDAGLAQRIDQAAAKLAEIRKDEPKPPEPEPVIEDVWQEVTTKKGRKTKVPKPRSGPPEGWRPKDPNHPTAEEWLIMSGNPVVRPAKPPPPPPPPAPERVAAEKELFALLVELIRRDHLVREFSFTRGLHALIFR